jgi:gluconolactonase
VFCTLKQPEGKKGSGGDGAAVDSLGNLYVTSALGLQVFNPKGELLGILCRPELSVLPGNVCFGGPYLRNLYVTVRTSVYVAPMEVSGRVSPSLR